MLRHCLREFRQPQGFKFHLLHLIQCMNRSMLFGFPVSVFVFAVQRSCQADQPLKVVVGLAGPENTGVFGVRRFVWCCEAFLVENGADDLCALQNHLHHVLIAMITRTPFSVEVENEYVHFFRSPYEKITRRKRSDALLLLCFQFIFWFSFYRKETQCIS